MSIPSIGGLASVMPTAYLSGSELSGLPGLSGSGLPGLAGAELSGLSGVTGAGAASASGGSAFAAVLGSIDSLQALQSTSNGLAVKAVTGDLDDVHDYTIAASEASVALELTAALRNKAVDAFTEIMRMQA